MGLNTQSAFTKVIIFVTILSIISPTMSVAQSRPPAPPVGEPISDGVNIPSFSDVAFSSQSEAQILAQREASRLADLLYPQQFQNHQGSHRQQVQSAASDQDASNRSSGCNALANEILSRVLRDNGLSNVEELAADARQEFRFHSFLSFNTLVGAIASYYNYASTNSLVRWLHPIFVVINLMGVMRNGYRAVVSRRNYTSHVPDAANISAFFSRLAERAPAAERAIFQAAARQPSVRNVAAALTALRRRIGVVQQAVATPVPSAMQQRWRQILNAIAQAWQAAAARLRALRAGQPADNRTMVRVEAEGESEASCPPEELERRAQALSQQAGILPQQQRALQRSLNGMVSAIDQALSQLNTLQIEEDLEALRAPSVPVPCSPPPAAVLNAPNQSVIAAATAGVAFLQNAASNAAPPRCSREEITEFINVTRHPEQGGIISNALNRTHDSLAPYAEWLFRFHQATQNVAQPVMGAGLVAFGVYELVTSAAPAGAVAEGVSAVSPAVASRLNQGWQVLLQGGRASLSASALQAANGALAVATLLPFIPTSEAQAQAAPLQLRNLNATPAAQRTLVIPAGGNRQISSGGQCLVSVQDFQSQLQRMEH